MEIISKLENIVYSDYDACIVKSLTQCSETACMITKCQKFIKSIKYLFTFCEIFGNIRVLKVRTYFASKPGRAALYLLHRTCILVWFTYRQRMNRTVKEMAIVVCAVFIGLG